MRVDDNPGIAAVLSLVVPGVGQIYNGDFLRGIFWLIVTPGMWLGTGGLFGWVCHVIAAFTAYSRAQKKLAIVGHPAQSAPLPRRQPPPGPGLSALGNDRSDNLLPND
jgi:TM2 domain-containing membrane protein YozV